MNFDHFQQTKLKSKMISVVLFFGIVIFCDGILIDDIIEWNLYKHKYSKHYDSFEEDLHRMVIWLEHKHQIEEHNQHYDNGVASFQMGFNEYSDVKHQDFDAQMNGYNSLGLNESEIDEGSLDCAVPDYGPVPTSVDWRLKGAVTKVKNQKHCGSCWSFAATGAIESHYFLGTKRLLSLSEQNLIDCSTSNYGCGGGLTTKAYMFVKNYGIKTEQSYPYIANNGYCKYRANSPGVKIKGFVALRKNDEDEILRAVAFVGPVAVSIDSEQSLHHYRSGIYYDHFCSSTFTNHAVLIVGYGTDEHQRDYYIVKNSWGPTWGENGYFRLARHHNHCGVAKRASYPVV